MFVTLFVQNTSPSGLSGLNDGHRHAVADATWGDRNTLRLPHNRMNHGVIAGSAAGSGGGGGYGGGGSRRRQQRSSGRRMHAGCRTADAMRAHTHEGKVKGGETTGTFGLDNDQRVVDAAVRLEGCGGGEQVSTRSGAPRRKILQGCRRRRRQRRQLTYTSPLKH